MNLLILGATGGTGRALVEQALEQGHTVTAFARNPAKVRTTHQHLRIAEGGYFGLRLGGSGAPWPERRTDDASRTTRGSSLVVPAIPSKRLALFTAEPSRTPKGHVFVPGEVCWPLRDS